MGGYGVGVLTRLMGHYHPDEVEDDSPYECLQCGTGLDVEYHSCPACGSYSIDRRWDAL